MRCSHAHPHHTHCLSRSAALLALMLTLCSQAAHTQTLPDTLIWERVGSIYDVEGMFFDADTLYIAPGRSIPPQVLRPGDTDFSRTLHPARTSGEDLLITPDRTIVVKGITTIEFSYDWAQSWHIAEYAPSDRIRALMLPIITPKGALLVGTPGITEHGWLVARSEDNGRSWTRHGLPPGNPLGATHLAVIPPSDSLPQGRIVAAGYGGIAYSDDDGRSWQQTAFYGALAYGAWGVIRIEHGPFAGRLLSVIERGTPMGAPTGIYQSTDGITWTRLSDLPGAGTFHVRLVEAPDGMVYAYKKGIQDLPIWGSGDGGASWVNLGPVWTQWQVQVEDMAVGPAGRLWVVCGGGTYSGYYGGVFRTVEPVVGVSREEEPEVPGKSGVELDVYPHPVTDEATVVLTLAEASEVRLAVYDVLGRTVALLHEGHLAAGVHRLDFNTRALPAGTYLLRAVVAQHLLSRPVAVVR